MPTVTAVTSADEILKARSIVNEVYIDEKIEQYIADIVLLPVILTVMDWQI